MVAVRADESAAEAVEALPELSCAGRRFDIVRARSKTAIHPIQKQCRTLRMSRGRNLRRCKTAGEIDPVVDIQHRVADTQLSCREILKALEDDLFGVGFAVAIGVLEIIEIWSAGDVNTAVP